MKNLNLTRFVKNTGFQQDYESRGYDKNNPKDYIQAAWLFGKYFIRSLQNRASGRLELDYTEIYITTHCSLQCRDCAVLIPYLKNHQHFSRESLLEDMERFFKLVDYVHRFGLLGGETFLHPDLPELIYYLIGQSKVGTIRMPTNGTILPSPELIKAMKSSPRILVSVSDYPLEISPKKERLIHLLDHNNIRYELYADQSWDELGICKREDCHSTHPSLTQTQLAQRFNDCWMHNCHGIVQGRYYLCGRAAFAPMAGIHESFSDDYVDLYGFSSTEQTRRAISDFIGRPYLQACAFCRGTGVKKVPPAVQVTSA